MASRRIKLGYSSTQLLLETPNLSYAGCNDVDSEITSENIGNVCLLTVCGRTLTSWDDESKAQGSSMWHLGEGWRHSRRGGFEGLGKGHRVLEAAVSCRQCLGSTG